MKVVETCGHPNPCARRFLLDGVLGDGVPRSFSRGTTDKLGAALFALSPAIASLWTVADMLTVIAETPSAWSEDLLAAVSLALRSVTSAPRKIILLHKI